MTAKKKATIKKAGRRRRMVNNSFAVHRPARRVPPCGPLLTLMEQFKKTAWEHVKGCKRCNDAAVARAAQEALERSLYI